LITDVLYGSPLSIWVAAGAAVLFLALWYGLGLVRILTGGGDDQGS
jgi:hypothetical protein